MYILHKEECFTINKKEEKTKKSQFGSLHVNLSVGPLSWQSPCRFEVKLPVGPKSEQSPCRFGVNFPAGPSSTLCRFEEATTFLPLARRMLYMGSNSIQMRPSTFGKLYCRFFLAKKAAKICNIMFWIENAFYKTPFSVALVTAKVAHCRRHLCARCLQKVVIHCSLILSKSGGSSFGQNGSIIFKGALGQF